MSVRRLLRCVSALVVMMAGCGQGDPAGDPFVVRDSAGVRLVEIRRGVTDTLRLTLDPSWPAGEPAALGDLLDVDVRTDGDWAVRLRPLHAHGLRWMARRAGAPEPVSEDDRNALEDLLIRSAAIGAGGVVPTGEARARLLAQVSFPSVKPALSRLLIGADGAVWIREVAPIADMGREALRVGSAAGYGGPWWTVLAPDGSVRSHVRLPDGFQVTRHVDGWLYGIQADALGVEGPGRVASPW